LENKKILLYDFQVSGHPLVNNYITQCLRTAQELLKLKTLSTVILLFCENNKHPLKKIIFDISCVQKEINIAR
jgi:hypothetical protein